LKSTEGMLGRVFMLRLEEGDMIPDCIEQFAMDNNISTAHVSMLGTLMEGEVIVGPRKTSANPPQPMDLPIYEAHETIAIGVIAPDKNENPVLHIHGALGRSGNTIMGCLRNGVKSWICCEAIVQEILEVDAKRLYDEKTSFTLLNLG